MGFYRFQIVYVHSVYVKSAAHRSDLSVFMAGAVVIFSRKVLTVIFTSSYLQQSVSLQHCCIGIGTEQNLYLLLRE